MFYQVVGWIGSILVVLAYLLVSRGKLQAKSSITYQVMNLVGTVGLGLNVFHQQAWPSFGLQIVWGLIAITALAGIARGKK